MLKLFEKLWLVAILSVVSNSFIGCGIFTQSVLKSGDPVYRAAVTKECREEIASGGSLKAAFVRRKGGSLCVAFQVEPKVQRRAGQKVFANVSGTIKLPTELKPDRGSVGQCSVDDYSNKKLDAVPFVDSWRWRSFLKRVSSKIFAKDGRYRESPGCLAVRGGRQNYVGCKVDRNSDSVVWSKVDRIPPNMPVVDRSLVANAVRENLRDAVPVGAKFALVDTCELFLSSPAGESCFSIFDPDRLEYYPVLASIPTSKLTCVEDDNPASTAAAIVFAPVLAGAFVLDGLTAPLQAQVGTMCGSNSCGPNALD